MDNSIIGWKPSNCSKSVMKKLSLSAAETWFLRKRGGFVRGKSGKAERQNAPKAGYPRKWYISR